MHAAFPERIAGPEQQRQSLGDAKRGRQWRPIRITERERIGRPVRIAERQPQLIGLGST